MSKSKLKSKSKSKSKSKKLKSPELFINRELSWLEFNDRVRQEGMRADVPLLERLKFLAIVSSNLDEFFQIRVAGLKQAALAGSKQRDVSGLAPRQQLTAISQRVHRMMAQQSEGIEEVLTLLDGEGMHLVKGSELSLAQVNFVRDFFHREILPVLTPLSAGELHPFPLLPGLRLNVAAALRAPNAPASEERKIVVVPLPGLLPRFITLPAQKGLCLTPLEDVVQANIGELFPGQEVLATALFRLTRDGDVAVGDDEVEDLLQAVEEAVRTRRRRAVVRVEVSARCSRVLRDWLKRQFEVGEEEIYEIAGLLDGASLMEIVSRPGQENLRDKEWRPQRPKDLRDDQDIWQTLRDRDVLLVHPYESFEPVIDLLMTAATDPAVLAIKQTLYRTSGESPIIGALATAAEAGKQVTVLVELRARFDEAKNVLWARRLEDAGCDVIYGIAGYKTHAKALLIVRREPHGIRRYVHLGTGNYNDRTARLYSDIAVMTANREIAGDVSAFFNLLTGYSSPVGWARLSVSPTGMRRRLQEMIDREILCSTKEQPGLILAKMNSLQDEGMIQALYRASQAGVKVRLNVRGICCLRPGVPGVSENIAVTSIIDRYLEHARIFYFQNAGHEEIYMGSADWMMRNLDRRVETLFPVLEERTRARLIEILHIYFADNVKSWRLRSDGEYEPVRQQGKPVRAQEWLHRRTVQSAGAGGPPMEFRPLRRGKR